jgi:hypothetical protein
MHGSLLNVYIVLVEYDTGIYLINIKTSPSSAKATRMSLVNPLSRRLTIPGFSSGLQHSFMAVLIFVFLGQLNRYWVLQVRLLAHHNGGTMVRDHGFSWFIPFSWSIIVGLPNY